MAVVGGAVELFLGVDAGLSVFFFREALFGWF